jgi:hypothetical protein
VRIEGTAARAPIHIDHAWVEQQMEELRQLLAADPMGARREIQKHVEDLQVAPGSDPGKRAVRITGRLKPDGLLGGEEAVRLQLVAGVMSPSQIKTGDKAPQTTPRKLASLTQVALGLFGSRWEQLPG